MADVLTVHDDSIISRVAWLIEQRKERIRLCERILSSRPEDLPPEYYRVNREAVQKELDTERWLLADLIEDIEDGLLSRELKEIEQTYCRNKAHTLGEVMLKGENK